MKGYLWTAGKSAGEGPERLQQWESMAVDAVGNVIEFWGFKRNQGRVWALLYLRGEALSAGEIEAELDLSKGGVSMLIRDLERWGVLVRVRGLGDSAWRYRAETNVLQMVTRVLEEREGQFLSRIRSDLQEAKRLATEVGGVPKEQMARLSRMGTLAEQTEKAVRLLIKTARLDVAGVFNVFREEPTSSSSKRMH